MKQVTVLVFLFGLNVASAQFGPRVPRTAIPRTTQPPDVPVDDPTPDFPLSVQIATIRFGGISSKYHGYGSGNLLDPAGTRGFDFTFECSVPFSLSNPPARPYEARWKKPSFRLELLMTEVGRDHEDRCSLEIALRPTPFDPANAIPLLHGVSTRLIVGYEAPDVAFTPPDPDYTVRLHVISTDRERFDPRSGGYGTGNLLGDASNLSDRGAQFTYDCRHGLLPNSQINDFYWGKWVEPDQRLEILMQRTGSVKVDRCRLKVLVSPLPFDPRHR